MGRNRNKKTIVENVEMTDIADKGRALGRHEDGRVIFVDGAVPGDVVNVLIQKKKKDWMAGKAIKLVKPSADRQPAFCEHFGVCGGCKWQHLSYEKQTEYKENLVYQAMRRIGKVEAKENFPILPSKEITYYRNKMEFSFSCKKWLTEEEVKDRSLSNREDVLGLHPRGAFDKVVNIDHCHLQGTPANRLRNFIRDTGIAQGLTFFDAYKNTGFLRNMVIRNTLAGEVMLIMCFHTNDQEKITGLLDAVIEEFQDELTTVLYCINPKTNDFLLDLDMIVYKGKGWVEEHLGHVKFKVGPKSFFQTNPAQAKGLYDVVVDFAGLTGEENVYDLYTGVGSIALYVAKYAKHVVGIEEVPDAIKDAVINQEMNDIDNCTFYAGDVKAILTDDFAKKHGAPDLVITDPPRAGMHADVVQMFLKLAAPKIVYVSCNPSTQARDLQLLSEKYEVLKIQPVDMFPHTHHVENVALLQK